MRCVHVKCVLGKQQWWWAAENLDAPLLVLTRAHAEYKSLYVLTGVLEQRQRARPFSTSDFWLCVKYGASEMRDALAHSAFSNEREREKKPL